MSKKYVYLILEIIILGIIVGLFISFYQFIIHEIINLSDEIFTSNNSLLISISFIISIILSFIIIILNNKHKGYLGSGIPQYEAYYQDKLNFSSNKMFLFVLFDSFYAYFCGFVFGGEGPSITLSASLGRMINKLFKNNDKDLVASCASAGFAVAFLAPLAGFCHLIEENKIFIKASFLIKGFFIILISTTIAYFIYPHNLLPINVSNYLEFKYFYIIVILTILAFIVGRLYVLAIVKVKDISKKWQYFLYLTPIFSLLFMYLKTKDLYMVGSGSNILANPLVSNSLIMVTFYLLYRLLGTAFSNSLAVSGGLVLPMLTLGCLIGNFITICFKDVIVDIYQYNNLFCIIGMMVVYNSVCKTPLTSLILGLKMGKAYVLLPLTIALVISTILMYLFKQKNIYGLLEKRIVINEAH